MIPRMPPPSMERTLKVAMLRGLQIGVATRKERVYL
jgi:hypothetical protein